MGEREREREEEPNVAIEDERGLILFFAPRLPSGTTPTGPPSHAASEIEVIAPDDATEKPSVVLCRAEAPEVIKQSLLSVYTTHGPGLLVPTCLLIVAPLSGPREATGGDMRSVSTKP